jgi:hypothetical protein
MPEYVHTDAADVLGIHQGLRVTFAETPTWFVPDMVATANLRDDLEHLISSMESGGYSITAVSNTVPPPGSQAWTIDFKPVGGSISVGDALNELEGGMFGPFDFLKRTYIRRVEKYDDQQWGVPFKQGDFDQPDTSCGAACWGERVAIGAAVVGVGILLYLYAPAIVSLVKGSTAKRRAA